MEVSPARTKEFEGRHDASLPTGWAWSQLGTVLPISYGKALPERERSGSGEFEVFGSSGVVGTHTAFVAPANSILIGRKGSAGSVYFSAKPTWPIDTAYFSTGSHAIDTRYGYWFLCFRKLGSLDQSTAIPSLSRDIYNVQPIPLAPLSEQRRIATRVDRIFAEIAEGEQALAEARKDLDKFRRALLKSAVSGELTKDWREINPITDTGQHLLDRIARSRGSDGRKTGRGRRAPDAPPVNTSSLPKLPEGWVWATLGQLFDVTTGSTPSRTNPTLWNGDIPWISSGEVAFCRIRSTRETITSAGLGNPETRFNPIGTVLLAMIGEGKTRGQCAILDIAAANNQNAAAIRVSKTAIPPEFIYHVLEERYFRSRKESQGGNQRALNAGKVAEMAIPLPPLAEMAEIVRRLAEALGAADDVHATLDAEAANVARLKQSILKAAFEGQLVPQDPADEPASNLLVRNLAAGTPTARKARGRPRKGQ